MKHTKKFTLIMSELGGSLASSMFGECICYLVAGGMTPEEIGEMVQSAAETQIRLQGTPEAVRTQAAGEQLTARLRDILDEDS